MKKKLLLASIVISALICLFAISVSAAVTTYNDAPTKNNITVSVDDVVVFKDGFSCPTAYVFKDQSTIAGGGHNSPSIAGAFDFSYIREKTGKEYSFADIVELDLPEGLTSVGQYAAMGITTLEKISFPKTITSLGQCIFQSASGLEECVFEHTETSDFKTFPNFTFYGCTNLKAFSMPDCITKVDGVAQFAQCTSLTAVYLSKNITTWSSGNQGSASFYNDASVYFVNAPFTYDNIPTKPSVYYFPKNLESISGETFKTCTNLNDYLVFGEKLTTIYYDNAPWVFNGCGGTSTIVFLGDMQSVKIGNSSSAFYWSVKNVIFANKNDVSYETAGITASKSSAVIFCNAEGNTTHVKEKTVTTEATCTLAAGTHDLCFCGYQISSVIVEGSTPLGHNSEGAEIVIYYPELGGAPNYFADSYHLYTCQRCKEAVDETVKGTALFTEKGYSKEEKGNLFTYGISLNKAAEKAYVDNGNVISYGFIIGMVNGTNGNIVNADGTSSLEKYIMTDFASSEYTNFSIYNVKMFDLSEEQKAWDIYCCAYVIDGDKVYYAGETVTTEALTISYNRIPPITETPDSGDEE